MSINLSKSESTEESLSEENLKTLDKSEEILNDEKDTVFNFYDVVSEEYSEENLEDLSEDNSDEFYEEFSGSSFDENEQEYLDEICSDSDSDLKIVLKFGYLVEIDGSEEIRLKVDDEKIIDVGLIAGLTQGEDLVDAFFTGNIEMKENNENIEFDEKYIRANNKEYEYNKIRIQMSSKDVFVVSNEDNNVILKIDNQVHEMFSSVIDVQDNTCVISVVNSKVSAAYVSEGEVLWINPIDLGKNNFNEEKSEIITRKKKIISLDDCYLRACTKFIYLHVDVKNPERTLILGKTENPFSQEEFQDFEDWNSEDEEWETEDSTSSQIKEAPDLKNKVNKSESI